jgi:SAM-dependent methyltransferase
LGSSSGESARLTQQTKELAPDSVALLDRVGLRPGDSAIDLGCGPSGVLELLAERVLPGGRVVGLDSTPEHVRMASELVAERGWEGVETIVGDARASGLAVDSFDLVHARTVLVTVPDPAPVLAEMVRLARPGGHVASMEADMEIGICDPPHPAVGRVSELFLTAFMRNGANPLLGRQVAGLYREAGLEDVTVTAVASVHPSGHTRRTLRVDLVCAMRAQIVQMGLAGEDELEQIDRAAREHLADPATLIMPGLMFLVSGRKPAPA